MAEWGQQDLPATTQREDLLIRNARIVPLHPAAPVPVNPVDLRLSNGLIADIGENLGTGAVETIDAEGRWLIPGLWDQHTHLGQWTLARQRLDLSAAGSPEEVCRIVGDLAAEEPGKPIISLGHRPGTWHRDPTVAELDEVTGITPAVLIAGDCHHAWLNSAALAALLLPPHEGVVAEKEWFDAYERLNDLSDADGTSPANYRATMAEAAAMGIVGMVDLEFTGGVPDWIERWAAGADLTRIRMATYAEGIEKVAARGLREGDQLHDDPRLMMGPLKIISDGSLNTRTAWCCEPYADGGMPGQPKGAANITRHELRHLMARAHMIGLEVATHAIGDAALDQALRAYRHTGARGSIEHAQLLRPSDAARMAELGVRASVQPAHLYDDWDITEKIWPDRGDRCFAFRWLADAGVELVLGSDAPVAKLDPWLAMAAAVHRSPDDRAPWHPEQALTVQESLAASTGQQPTPHLGARADVALLDSDPLAEDDDTAAAATRLRGMQVALTVCDGRVTHRAL